MTPQGLSAEQRLGLVWVEVERWQSDGRASPGREAVFLDRLGWILGVDTTRRV